MNSIRSKISRISTGTLAYQAFSGMKENSRSTQHLMPRLFRQRLNITSSKEKDSVLSAGFTITEVVIATVILPLLIVAVAQIFNLVRTQYAYARQYNEVYAVLSACPELDRALQYELLSSETNCFPNNIFTAEGGYTNMIEYNPSLSVADTEDLDASDSLKAVPDSKVVDLSVGVNQNNTNIPLKIRLLITRSGIGQL